ncbi:uncharacterized protein TRIADDRAFT_56278 [Trichoplax adhaerens]|uniref:RecQ-mediated genome instability protein 1 n=1 Tax=Trichoplax adhaerens TaxID=10228 RepID=B3RXP3_TRIAD|nr:hypothetical protein TRIADDRAFT_56278 [Trichoplax adhaerens]EDV24466.1 hypothetical protein TRIADDRAFT_56278 [Trichoplax adhaerens]|eukprot:XP_002112356.1 hypothetical protein TRIADDRAFT_56278 [Trichoplax adhaerens]
MEELKQWFAKQFGLNVREDWLKSNINQAKSTNDRDSLYRKFLHSDIRDVSNGYLTNAHTTQSTIQLNGKICMQVDSLYDIGRSAYSQLRQCQGNDDTDFSEADNNDKKWEPKPTRMLLLTLNDGIRDVEAMEYQPIPELSYKTPIGAKILIIGPVTMRSAMILLDSQNIRLLGGSLPNLDGKGHQDRLRQLLNLPDDHPLATKINQNIPIPMEFINANNETINPLSIPRNKFNNDEKWVKKPYSASINTHQQVYDNIPQDKSLGNKSCKNEDIFIVDDDFDDADLLAMDEDIFSQHFQKPKNSKVDVKIEASTIKREYVLPIGSTKSNNDNLQPSHSGIIKNENDAYKLSEMQNTKLISTVDSENPILYLIDIENDLRKNSVTFPFTFHIKAYFSTLLSPLNSRNKWHVKARINDGTSYLDVDVSDQVLSEIIGFSAEKFNKLKLVSDQSERKLMQQGLKNCQQTLSQINCVMEIILNRSAVPLLIQLKQSTIYNMKNLITRVKCRH